MSKLIGIDLGTTNSCVAVMEGGESVVIPTAEGARTTPSVVAFSKDGQRLIGLAAKRQATVNAQRTISSIKREMGGDYHIKIDGKIYTAPEISAMILAKLKQDATDYLGEPVTDAVITVPAYFTDAQRQATKDAGLIAGLNVQRIINEPTAAALAYGVDKEQAQKIMVYDLGGGTFDVSVLDINNGVIQVLATAGNNRLGGDDFDQAIVRWLLEEFRRLHKIDLSKDAMALERLREAAEKAKIELSGVGSTVINLPFLTTGKDGPLHLETTLSRAKFNELTRQLVQATTGPVQQALRDAGLAPSELAKVLLVGGSTRIPAVQEEVKRLTGQTPFKGINPDECVAVGASLQGGVLAGTVKDLLLLDVTPLSLGIETLGGVCTRLIERNSTIPVQKRQIFTTAAPFQSAVDVHVLQGERPMARDNKTLGRFRLNGIRRAMRGVPQIEVTFDIDANGIVNVSAKDLSTGKEQSITLTASSNLSQSEIDQAIRDARQYAAADQARRAETEAEQNLELLLYQGGVMLKKCDKSDRPELEEALKEAKSARRGKNVQDKIHAAQRLQSILDRLQAKTPLDDNDFQQTPPEGGPDSQGADFYDAEFESKE